MVRHRLVGPAVGRQGGDLVNPTKQPRVSIVMPLFNKGSLVLEAIASVQAQEIADWELVVVDDGSTDGGPEQVRAVSTSDPRIRLVAQENQGVSAARNTGIRQSLADIIAFLDADDLWQPGFLAAVLALRERFPTARWWATGYLISAGNEMPRVNRLSGLPTRFVSGLIPDYFVIAATSDPPVWTSATAVERQLFLAEDAGFPIGVRSGEDLLTWARLAQAYPLAYDRRALAIFRVSGIERRPDADDAVGKSLAALHQAHPATPGLAAYRAAWHRMRGAMWLRFGDLAAARCEAGQALRLAPWNPRSIYLWMQCRLPAAWRRRLDAWIRGARARIMRAPTSTAPHE